MEGANAIVTAIVAVWQQVLTWFTGTFSSVTSFFYASGALTFPGVLAVIMAGIALVLLVFNLIRSFLPMRG